MNGKLLFVRDWETGRSGLLHLRHSQAFFDGHLPLEKDKA